MVVTRVDIILHTRGGFFKLTVNFYEKFTLITPKMKIQSLYSRFANGFILQSLGELHN